MLDIKLIRKDPNYVEKKVRAKEPSLTVSTVLSLDEKIRHLKTETEQLLAERKKHSKTVGEKKRAGAPCEDLMQEVRVIGETISKNEHHLEKLEEAFFEEISKLPNLPMDDVKVSQDKEENEIIKVWGKKREFHFAPKNHLELNERLQFFDFKRTAQASGAGWPAYRGMGARLELALINHMLEVQQLRGFELWLPPALVRPNTMMGSGQLPKFQGQFYETTDELYLVPTAEVILNGLHLNEIIDADQLPMKYCAYTPCFRKEAGAAGAEERGLIRVHQFNKVELFAFAKPEESEAIFEHMVASAEEVLQSLGLHYRLSRLVTADMSFTAAKTIDVEVWLPGQNRYYEVSSISNCTDYQARRSQTRFREGNGKPELVHTLNGSGLATPRLMVALLENNQNEDGTVSLPPLLAERVGASVL